MLDQRSRSFAARLTRLPAVLRLAVSLGSVETVKGLLESGVRAEGVDSNGRGAVELARLAGHEGIARLIEQFIGCPVPVPDSDCEADSVPSDIADTGWEVDEPDSTTPTDPSVIEEADATAQRLASLRLLDDAGDWSDVEIDIPETRAPAERFDTDRSDRLRALLGSVLLLGRCDESWIEAAVDVTSSDMQDVALLFGQALSDSGVFVEPTDQIRFEPISSADEDDLEAADVWESFESLLSAVDVAALHTRTTIRIPLLDAQQESAVGEALHAVFDDLIACMKAEPAGEALMSDWKVAVDDGKDGGSGDGGEVARIIRPDPEVLRSLITNTPAFPDTVRARLFELLDSMQERRWYLVKHNLRLAVHTAYRYRWTGEPLADLIQEATLGLIRAVDGFDHLRGFRFSTYALWWIRQAILRAVDDKHRLIRVPVHRLEELHRLESVREKFFAEHDREPTLDDLTAMPEGFSLKNLLTLRKVPQDPPDSETVGDQGPNGFGAIALLPSTLPDLETHLWLQQVRSWLESALGTLTEQQAEVLRLRFGLDDGDDRTLEQIGATMGVTRERVRQIEKAALKQMKVLVVRGNLQGGLAALSPSVREAFS